MDGTKYDAKKRPKNKAKRDNHVNVKTRKIGKNMVTRSHPSSIAEMK